MNIVRIVVTALFLLASGHAAAEKCWMVGCEGFVGYVYVPWSQVSSVKGQSPRTFTLNGKAYPLDTSSRLFTQGGLPGVGATVQLNIDSALLTQEEISLDEVKAEIRKDWLDRTPGGDWLSYHEYELWAQGMPMRRGARLTILGYAGQAIAGTSELFALVRVESD